jgi:hypothetical protein
MMGQPQDLKSAPTPLKPYAAANDNEIFAFEHSTFKPECCPSTMSCDGGGCVCTTPEDRDLINTRGGNRRDRRNPTRSHEYDEDM